MNKLSFSIKSLVRWGIVLLLFLAAWNKECLSDFTSRVFDKIEPYFLSEGGWQGAKALDQTDFIDVSIDTSSQKQLEECLSSNPVSKNWVEAFIKINEGHMPVKLKFHGSDYPHYENGKYSYTIKAGFKENAFRRFKLIKAEQASPHMATINQLAREMGLISAHGKMCVLRINGEEKGHYYKVDDIKSQFLKDEYGIERFALISNTSDWTRKEGRVHFSEYDFFTGHVENRNDSLFPLALGRYKVLGNYVKSSDVIGLKPLIDADYMAKYLALAAVFNDVHFMCGDNLKYIYNFDTRKFYPIYRAETGGRELIGDFDKSPIHFDQFLFHSLGEDYAEAKTNDFFKLLLTDPEIRQLRNVYLNEFLENRDSLYEKMEASHKMGIPFYAHAGGSQKEFQSEFKSQRKIVDTILSVATDYLNYTHVYGTIDESNNSIELAVDAFVPVDVCYGNDVLLENVVGLELNRDLEFEAKYITVDELSEGFDPRKLVFVNGVTQDTVARRYVYINELSLDSVE